MSRFRDTRLVSVNHRYECIHWNKRISIINVVCTNTVIEIATDFSNDGIYHEVVVKSIDLQQFAGTI